MSKVAEALRQAREGQSLTVYQVAEITKVRTDHIRALEEGNYDVFSAPVYVRGFVRTYAKLLKLDVHQILADLNEELSHSKKHHEPPPLSASRRTILDLISYQLSKLKWRLVAPIAVIVFLLAAGWYVFHSASQRKATKPLPQLSPGVYQPQRNNSGQTLPLPTTPGRR